MNPVLRVALVTGANRGIGRESCRQLAKAGFRVIMTARDEEKGRKICKELSEEDPDIMFRQLDVTDETSLAKCIGDIQRVQKRLDVLVNNAGLYLDEGKKLTDIPRDALMRTLDVNLHGPYRMIRAVLPIMKKQKYGRIVNISSGYGAMDSMTSGTGSYKISKLALNGLTRIMADEVNGRQIKINAMCPGWVRTDMGGRLAPRSPKKATETILWLAQLDEKGPTGGFFRDKKSIEW